MGGQEPASPATTLLPSLPPAGKAPPKRKSQLTKGNPILRIWIAKPCQKRFAHAMLERIDRFEDQQKRNVPYPALKHEKDSKHSDEVSCWNMPGLGSGRTLSARVCPESYQPRKSSKQPRSHDAHAVRIAHAERQRAGPALATTATAPRRLSSRRSSKASVHHRPRTRCSIAGSSSRHGRRSRRRRRVHARRVLGAAGVILTAGTLAGGISGAVGDALVVGLGAGVVGDGEGVLGGVWLLAGAADAAVY